MRGMPHLLLGGAAAAALVGIGAGMTMTLLRTSGASRAMTALLMLLSVAVLVRLLLASPVRPAEAQLARVLLDAPVPELGESHDREARVSAAVWALIVVAVGGVSLFLLLLLVPGGLGLVMAPWVDDPLRISGIRVDSTVARWSLVPVGVLCVGLAAAAQVVGVRLLRRWAPVWLRPSAEELLAAEQERVRKLAAGNAIARDLHDSIGHALTAIGRGRRGHLA